MAHIDNNPSHKRHNEGKKKDHAKNLFTALQKTPISRRMAATEIGCTDQTYMVTQFVYDWIRQGKAQVIGQIRCTRSGRKVEAITTDPDLFKDSADNQLNLF
jgi:hypothetical protein